MQIAVHAPDKAIARALLQPRGYAVEAGEELGLPASHGGFGQARVERGLCIAIGDMAHGGVDPLPHPAGQVPGASLPRSRRGSVGGGATPWYVGDGWGGGVTAP